MKLSVKKLILIVIALIVLYVGGNTAWFYLKYAGAEKILRGELEQMNLPEGFAPVSTAYTHGQCASNCPRLRSDYIVRSTREEVGNALKFELENNGYIVSDVSRGEVIARKGKVVFYSEATSKNDIRTYLDDVSFVNTTLPPEVDEVVINFEYKPAAE
jgi:hypothetical protein